VDEITKDTFEAKVIQSEKPVLVDFWGPQCVPCLELMPKVEALEEKYGARLKVGKVEAPKNRRLCLELKVLGLPTFLLYRGGKEIDRLSGNDLSIQKIEDSVGRALQG
jgi:thioredoxin 1